MSLVYAQNLLQLMISELDQFQSDDTGSNIGIGYSGFDEASDYSRINDLDHFGAIFQFSADAEEPMSFSYGMWRWSYLVRMFTRYDGKDVAACDANSAALADDFVNMMFDATNRHAINDNGWAKLVAANYIGDILNINDMVYISMEFLVTVKVQI